MTANSILIIVIGLFLVVTGGIYLFQIRNNQEAVRRDKIVSIVLMIIGILVMAYPVVSEFSSDIFQEEKSKSSNLLGPDYYNRPVQQDHSGYEKASELYRKAASKWNVQLSGYDSADVVMERLDRSIALYETAEAYTARGQLKVQMSMFKSALKDYDRAIELKPEFGNAYYNRATVYYIMGNNDGACADWKMANGLGVPNTEETIKMLCN